MNKTVLMLFALIITSIINAETLEFKGMVLTKSSSKAKYYTKLNNKDFCTTIEYVRIYNKKFIIKITENQNNKEFKKYTLALKDKEIFKLNEVSFQITNFGNEIIISRIKNKEKYTPLI